MDIKDMSKLDIQIRLLDVIEEREETAFKLKETNNSEEAMLKYRALDKEMNDLIKALANGQATKVNYKDEEVDPEVLVQKQLEENFSPYTGKKLHETCPKCWVKGNRPYNCGLDKCPGHKLFMLEK